MNLDQKENSESHAVEGSKFREEVYSKAVRAGKRTYFFDVKSTRKNEYYLTITESKKRNDTSGNIFYEKHKIFLYKEDFEKFSEGLAEIIEYIKENQPIDSTDLDETTIDEYSNIDFDDLNS